MVNTLINNPGTSHGATTLPSGGRKSNRRKKSMKKKGKTAKKRKTKKARKTRRRKGAGNNPSKVTRMYRFLHEMARGEKSKGEHNEIRAADAKAAADKVAAAAAAKAKKDADYLKEIIRKDPRYIEMDDISQLKTKYTYVLYQGADMDPPLLPLGNFIERVNGVSKHLLSGIPITVKFKNKDLEGNFRTNADLSYLNNTSIKGLIFKVKSDAEEEDGEDPISFSDITGRKG